MTAVLETPQTTTLTTPIEAPALEITFPVSPVVDRHTWAPKVVLGTALAIAIIVAGAIAGAISLVVDGTLTGTPPVLTTQTLVFEDVASANSATGELTVDTTAGQLTATQAQVDMMAPSGTFTVTIQSNSDGTANLVGAPVPVDD